MVLAASILCLIKLTGALAAGDMRPFVSAGANVPLCQAIHCLLAIPPLVNYLTSPLLDEDVVRKRANAVAFAHGLRDLAKLYWSESSDRHALDVDQVVQAFRRHHRQIFIPAHAAVQLMYQTLVEATDTPGNLLSQFETHWLTHEPGCAAESVQQLVNIRTIQGLPTLVFVRIDRGDRPRRFVNYGTSFKLVKNNLPNTRMLKLYVYELYCVLTEGDNESKVLSRVDNAWQEASEDTVAPLADLNQIISGRAQILVYLLKPQTLNG